MADFVSRPVLFERLSAAAPGTVTLVCAPAGSGKTVLLRSWAAQIDEPVAWVTVERGERDSQRFSFHVIDALADAAGDDVIERVSPAPGFAGAVVLERLLEQLERLDDPVQLVIDDLHELDSEDALRPNVLLVHIQPDEGVSLAVGAKVPGQGMSIRTVHMDFLYGGAFRTGLPEAYERLILDCMLGDATLFTRADEVEEQWALVDSMVAPWKRDRPNFPNYAAGTWGPVSADELIHRDGRSWRRH